MLLQHNVDIYTVENYLLTNKMNILSIFVRFFEKHYTPI